ncbi:MAG: hypothetical protein ACR65R_11775 [Methylomicrobium sp.]
MKTIRYRQVFISEAEDQNANSPRSAEEDSEKLAINFRLSKTGSQSGGSPEGKE